MVLQNLQENIFFRLEEAHSSEQKLVQFQKKPTFLLLKRLFDAKITTFSGYLGPHTTRKHIQHYSIQETNTHRPISSLGQQSSHNSQTKCLQYFGIQGKGSIFNTGLFRQGITTHHNCSSSMLVPQKCPQSMELQAHQQQSTKQLYQQ